MGDCQSNRTRSNNLNVLGISASPRPSGNTATLLEKALAGARAEGAETELLSLAGKEIKPCDGCNACFTTGSCHIEDDMADVYGRMTAADGIIFGSPVYLYGMPAQLKALIDRTYAPPPGGGRLTNKVGGIVVVAGSVGVIDVVKDLYFYFAVKKMLPGGWLGAYATGKGDVENLTEGLKAAHELGRETVQIAAQGFKFPRGFQRVHFAFGTHTH